MEPRSLTPSLLLTLFLPHLLSAAVSSSPSAPPPSSSPSASPSRPPPPPITPSKQVESDQSHFRRPPPRNIPPPRPRSFCSSGHGDCHQSQGNMALKTPSKPERNFGKKLGLLFVGVAAALQVLLGSFLVYKRIQLKKVQRREQCNMASSSGLLT